jgi:hypothetical protein
LGAVTRGDGRAVLGLAVDEAAAGRHGGWLMKIDGPMVFRGLWYSGAQMKSFAVWVAG